MMNVIDSGDQLYQAIVAELEGLAQQEVAVGILSGHGAEEEREAGLTMAQLGAIHEFGAPEANIPERSFLRHTADARREDVADLLQRGIAALSAGEATAKMVYDATGAFLSGAVKEYITEGEGPPPPLSPVTIRRKGSTHRLIDTGRLLGSITYEIRPKGAGSAEEV